MVSAEEDAGPSSQEKYMEELAEKPLLPVDDDFPFRKLTFYLFHN
jgi:hypothetical protein